MDSAAARNGGVSLPQISSAASSSRKEWRKLPEQSVRNSGGEELERSKLGQSDERLIYEVQLGGETVDVDFRSVNAGGVMNNDILQQRLHAVAKQREELQHIEIELRAQAIARSEIVGLQNNFDAQLKDHANANVKLKEKLQEKEQKILELERKLDGQERELHAIRLDNEAVWAKEDLLREQSKELQSYRRERDNSEAERAQHIKQIHDLQEHIPEKERQIMELQEQHRVAQETILFKDEQLREAQAWITRVQEMDALQSNSSHALQTELRERTEQCNQLWLGCQRQFGEMERLHMHIQQLQLELVDLREKSGTYPDSKDASQLEQNNGSQLEVNGNGNSGNVQNGNSESAPFSAASTQPDHVHSVAFAPPSLIGMPPYLPAGQVTAMHPFVMHQQGVLHPSHVAQSHFHSVPIMPSIQNWQNQEVLPEGQNVPVHNSYEYESSVNGQVIGSNYLDTNITQGLDAGQVGPQLNGEGQVLNSVDISYENAQSEQISSQFREALRLNPSEQGNDTKEKKVNPVNDHVLENNTTTLEFSNSIADGSSSEAPPAHAVNFSETSKNPVASTAVLVDAHVSTGQKSNLIGKYGESYLLDERSLLASIARTIGSGGRIKMSTTLPNRLGKMLAPLHWADYKKAFGKLDEFVASHPELFILEGDYIQLREGAQETIAATAAIAKVAAAAAAPSSYSSVSVTPMAQSNRLKKVSSIGSNSEKNDFPQSNGATKGRPSGSTVGKQQTRAIGLVPNARR